MGSEAWLPERLQQTIKSARRRPLWTPGASTRQLSVVRNDIERLLPHRDPFLLIDEVTQIDFQEQTIRGRRHIDENDPVFRGHFPGQPVYPGVLQLEIVGQLGLCLLHLLNSGAETITASTVARNIRAVRVHFAEFLSPVSPGADLDVLCRAIEINDFTGIFAGQVLRGDAICSFGVSEVYFLDE